MKSANAITPSIMSGISVFFDSSALFAGVVSANGAARALLLLAERKQIQILVCEQVIAETEHALARKVPAALAFYRQALRASHLRIVHDPLPEEIHRHHDLIAHAADIPIVLAAMHAQADFLVTLNRRHFIDDPGVASRSGLRIGTPGDALQWIREQLAS